MTLTGALQEHSVNEEELQALAASFASSLAYPAIVYLSGELGTGKSTFVRAALRSLGVVGPIKSPTFTLVESYELDSLRINHLDLYRLTESEELEFLGFRDICESSDLLMVEWPEMASDELPAPTHHVTLRYPTGDPGDVLKRDVSFLRLP